MTEEEEKQPKEEMLVCPTETYLDEDGKWKTRYKPGTTCDRVMRDIQDSLTKMARRYFDKHIVPEEPAE